MPEWVLLVATVLNTATLFGPDVRATIPFKNQAACQKAAADLSRDTKGMAFACVSTETGEVVGAHKPN